MHSESDAQFLKRAALIDAMYEIVDPGQNLDPKRVNTETAAQLFDELVKAGADVNAPPPVKRDLVLEKTIGRIAEASFLGKVASAAYWDTYLEGRTSIAQGVRGLIEKVAQPETAYREHRQSDTSAPGYLPDQDRAYVVGPGLDPTPGTVSQSTFRTTPGGSLESLEGSGLDQGVERLPYYMHPLPEGVSDLVQTGLPSPGVTVPTGVTTQVPPVISRERDPLGYTAATEPVSSPPLSGPSGKDYVAAGMEKAPVKEGSKKTAQGIRALMDKIRGGTAEESLERKIKLDSLKRQRDEGQRRHELGIRPDELGLAEQEGAQGETAKKRELTLKELEQRQGMAEELRQLQIADQYAKRSREKRLFERLHGGGALGAAAGGGIAGAAIGSVLGKPGGIPIGIAAGLGLNALTGKDRALAQLEKERVMPRSMQGEVVP